MMRGLIRERPTQFGFCWPSIDLVITSGLLHESGHHLSYLDASTDKLSVSDVAGHIRSNGIEVVVSLYSHFHNRNDVAFLSDLKCACPQLQIVILPDIQYVLMPQKALNFLNEHSWLDAIILSITSNDLDRFLTGNYSGVLKNLCYRVNGEACLGSKDVVSANDYRLPIPRHDLFKSKKYFLPESRDLYVTATCMQFGCPFHCDFCLDKEAYRKSWCRSPENMLEEFIYIAKCGFTEVYLRDLTFGLNRKRALEFCRLLIMEKLPLRWVCTTRVDTVDEELLTLMKQAGCFCIEFGVESGIDETLDIHKKGTKNDQAVTTFNICRKLGIEAAMFMIVGFPEESREDIEKSLKFAFELNGEFLSLNLANLLPETDFEKTSLVQRDAGSDSANPWETYNFDSQNFSHPTISKDEMLKIRAQAMRRFYFRPKYIIGRLFKMRSFGALLRVVNIGLQVLALSVFSQPKDK